MTLTKLKGNKYARAVGALIAAVLLGAIGSGVWDLILKHSIISGRDLLLNTVSFGMKSIKDYTYTQIARGLHEEASLNVLQYFVSLLMLTVIVLVVYIIVQARGQAKGHKSLIQMLDKSIAAFAESEVSIQAKPERVPKPKELSPHESKMKLEALRQSVLTKTSRAFGVVDYIAILSSIVWISFTAADLIRFSYVNSAITHFHQLYAVTAPYIDIEKKAEITSSFAQIRNKEDYVGVIDRLEAVGKDKGLQIPSFSPW